MAILDRTMPAGIHTPTKFGPVARLHISLLITAGVPSVVEAESSDQVTGVTDNGAGQYEVAFDGTGAKRCVGSSGSVESADASPTGGLIVSHTALTLNGTSSTVEIQCVSTGSTLADPETLSTVRYTLELATR